MLLIVLDWWMLSGDRDRKGIPIQTTGAATWKLRRSSSGPWHNHVSTLSRMEGWRDRDVGHWQHSQKQLDLVLPWMVFIDAQTEDITKDWIDVVILFKLAAPTTRRAVVLSTICRWRVTCVNTSYSNSVNYSQPGSQGCSQSTSIVGCQRPPYTKLHFEVAEAGRSSRGPRSGRAGPSTVYSQL